MMQELKSCASVAIREPEILLIVLAASALIDHSRWRNTSKRTGSISVLPYLRYLKQQITRAVHPCRLPRMEQQRGRRTFHYRRTGDAVARPQQLHTEYRSLDELLEINLALADTGTLRVLAFPFIFLELRLIRFRRRRYNKISDLDAGFSISRPFAVDSFIGLFENNHDRVHLPRM